MAAWTLADAQAHLAAWLAADLALATGKEYRMADGVMLTREHARNIKERISFWSREVKRLEGRKRVRRGVPYDL